MKLAKELQDYLDRNGLIVDVVGLKVAVIDREGKVVSTGATIHTTVKKAILCNVYPCQFSRTWGKKMTGSLRKRV